MKHYIYIYIKTSFWSQQVTKKCLDLASDFEQIPEPAWSQSQ